MKFTEGYWLKSEKANALYASEAYEITEIPGGMRILAPVKKIVSRGDTLNTPALVIEFVASDKNIISVRTSHYLGYDNREPDFEKTENRQQATISINSEQAVMCAGNISIIVNRREFSYQFMADGRVITECGFHNTGYIRWERKPLTMLPEENYMQEDYIPYMMQELSISPGECIYGLGERFTAFVKNGQTVDIWNEDGGTSSQISYKNIPFYISNKGYGIFVDHTEKVSFEVASEKVEYVGFSVKGEELRYDFIYGPGPGEIIQRYTKRLGRPALPPAWSFGLWLSTSFTTDYDEQTVTSFIDGMRDRNIPLSVFHFDCFWMKEFHWCDFEWDNRVFPDVWEMIRRYKERGLRICVWINPYVAQGTEFFNQGLQKGYFIKRRDGKGLFQTDCWQSGMAIVDFTNPAACKWYTEKLRTLLKMGVDCFKTDFGERIPISVSYFDGSAPDSMHNYYTYLYNQCVFNLLKEYKGEKEAVVFARSAAAGCQQFPVHWGGDCSASYASMAETLRGGLSLAMSGFAFWSHDISGFESTASADLYKRWVAFGLFSTHSRLHGSQSYRVPWMFDEEACEVLKFFTHLKCRLMPYIYAEAVEAHKTGAPVMRPMVYEFYKDPAVCYLDMQYMLGRSILVAPIFNERSMAEYYLPDGVWTDFFTGNQRKGSKWYKDTYDYFSLPVYIRENTILPMSLVQDRFDYEFDKNLTIHLYRPGKNENSCKIVNQQGIQVNKITTIMKKNTLYLKTENISENIEYVVHDASALISVKGARYQNVRNDLYLYNVENMIEIKFEEAEYDN